MILPDSIRNYMTKFLSDDWQYEFGFMSEQAIIDSYTPKLVPDRSWGQGLTVGQVASSDPVTVDESAVVSDVIQKMTENSAPAVAVVDSNNAIVGVVTHQSLIDQIYKGKVQKDSPLGKSVKKNVRKISSTSPVTELGRVFARGIEYVIVDDSKLISTQDYMKFFAEN